MVMRFKNPLPKGRPGGDVVKQVTTKPAIVPSFKDPMPNAFTSTQPSNWSGRTTPAAGFSGPIRKPGVY